MTTGRSQHGETNSTIVTHDQMGHWPATVGAQRMRRAAETMALMGTQQEIQEDDPQLAQDRRMLKITLDAARYATEGLEKIAQLKYEPEKAMRTACDIARAADTDNTIGLLLASTGPHLGPDLMSVGAGAIPRDRDWLGASAWYPQMRNSIVIIHESERERGRIGWVFSIPTEQEYPVPDVPCPPGDPNLLRSIILWHGASDVRWMPQDRGPGRGGRTLPVTPREPALV